MTIDSLSSQATSLALLQAAQKSDAQGMKNLKDAREMQRFEDAARDFESVFISEMIKPMFEGISADGMFGGGKGEEIFRGLMIQEYGKMLAKDGGIGLSAPLKEQMIKMQEQANHATTPAY